MTCEDLQGIALQRLHGGGVIAPDMVIVSHGEQTAIGHEPGHGPISEGEAVIADLYPQDPVSGCYADMTRTFCMGEPPEELVRYHGLVKEALDRVRWTRFARASREGAPPHDVRSLPGARLPDAADKGSRQAARGRVLPQPRPRRRARGARASEPRTHWATELVAGDVLAVEPGLYRKGFGGCRLEDLVLVTDDGGEVLTDFDYELAV